MLEAREPHERWQKRLAAHGRPKGGGVREWHNEGNVTAVSSNSEKWCELDEQENGGGRNAGEEGQQARVRRDCCGGACECGATEKARSTEKRRNFARGADVCRPAWEQAPQGNAASWGTRNVVCAH
ncbi:hypothetical protein ERJ75_000815800 [Trypanosoma vivax]|nr:hypothetical protein ERJ75_000815800 [Trypanosoma vivax]